MKIRLYGTSIGDGSFARVTQGVGAALQSLKLLAGVVPVDAYDAEDGVYGGHDAEVGVLVGNPNCAAMMAQIGWHKERWVLLPVNSTYVPAELVAKLEADGVTGWLAPSDWAREILQAHTRKPVLLWQHGVSTTFEPKLRDHLARWNEVEEDKRFAVLHLASTTLQRKGTRELVEAWALAKARDWLPERAALELVVEGSAERLRDLVRGVDLGRMGIRQREGRANLSEDAAAALYRSVHVVAQPSRGEGFGIVPLEAAACGTPVLITRATGHGQYIEDVRGIEVECGVYEPIDDGPGATAPALVVPALAESLRCLYKSWTWLQQDAWDNAPNVHQYWNWCAGTERWLHEREKWLADKESGS